VYANPGKYTVSLTITGPGGKSTKVRANYISAELPPGISVVTPNGGEIWPQGSTQTIAWSYTGSPGSVVRIELLSNGKPVSTLSAASPIGKDGAGSRAWKIPLSRAPGDHYKISLRTDKDLIDVSDDNFTITEAQ
jgi:PKD repeat protein